MILRSMLATSTLLAATAALGACAGGPLEPIQPVSVREATYVCDGGGRLTARFERGAQRILFVGGTDLDGRELNVPKNSLLLIPDQGEPLRLAQGAPATSTGFYYRSAGGYGFSGDGGRATLITPSGSVACRLG